MNDRTFRYHRLQDVLRDYRKLYLTEYIHNDDDDSEAETNQ
jgi:hypothetical protein